MSTEQSRYSVSLFVVFQVDLRQFEWSDNSWETGLQSLNLAIMTSKSPSTKKETKADALQQYQNSDGHFSLVRYVHVHVHATLLQTHALTPRQQLPTGRPRYDHEWLLRLLFHLLICEIPRIQ